MIRLRTAYVCSVARANAYGYQVMAFLHNRHTYQVHLSLCDSTESFGIDPRRITRKGITCPL
jgi:hypothetical protein